MKKSIEARALLQSALELSPTDLTVRDLLARANRQAVNEPTTQTPEFYIGLSLQLYREERYAESIAASRAALALRPNYAEAWNNIGAAYNKLGRYDKAGDACEEALRLKPDSNWREIICNTPVKSPSHRPNSVGLCLARWADCFALEQMAA